MRVALVFLLAFVIASAADHLLGSWLGFPGRTSRGYVGAYRRLGPETGPQVFCAGSSLMVAGLYWSEVSQVLGEGIETWSVAGSSPDIWEQWQRQSPRSNTTIVAVSVYDLNELHVAPERADVVPLATTIQDLWASHAAPDLAHRILNEYAIGYLHITFPTAGNSDKMLSTIREKVAGLVGRQAVLAEHEGIMVEPSPPALATAETTASLNDWSSGRLARRLAVMRAENRGRHEFFHGPKHVAFDRLLSRARMRGKVIVIVLPVAPQYADEFLDGAYAAAFDKEIHQVRTIVPDATIVRLDRLPGISDPANFLDLAHMNSRGRRIATTEFVREVIKNGLSSPTVASASADVQR
jgi:hypothetical protein